MRRKEAGKYGKRIEKSKYQERQGKEKDNENQPTGSEFTTKKEQTVTFSEAKDNKEKNIHKSNKYVQRQAR